MSQGESLAKPVSSGWSACGLFEAAQSRLRSRYFVGRETELRAFGELLAAGELPRIVFVHGPGGIGKSSLLKRFGDLADRAGHRFAALDARQLAPSPAAVDQAVTAALEALPHEPQQARVLALDHVEQLSALDGWLREYLLPKLPADLLLVLASRDGPDAHWRADPGLAGLLTEYVLTRLDADSAADYLERRGVDRDQARAIRDFAHGSPLALTLAADQALREPDKPFDIGLFPDLIRGLLQWLLHDVNDRQQLLSLQACASVRRLDEPLLAAMLDRQDAARSFDWLADQSFTDRQPDGLIIHDLVRDIVIHDLRSRNLERHHALIRRAVAHVLNDADTTQTRFRFKTVPEIIYALRLESHVREQLGFGDVRCYPDHARADEIDALAAVVERLEGPTSRAWFVTWAQDAASELVVIRDIANQPLALALFLRIGTADEARTRQDPCPAALFRYLRRHAPLRADEQVLLVRFRMTCDRHQARTPVWAELTAHINGAMFTPGISMLASAADLTYDWSGMEANAEYRLLADSEYEVDGRSYKISAHDLRSEPAPAWARNTVERVLRAGHAPELRPAPVTLLDEPAFADAVRRALRHFGDDQQLAGNPLLQSPMMRRHGAQRDPAALRRILQAAAARQSSLVQNMLELAYFQAVGAKQTTMARDLCVSERTLRRRLQNAQQSLIDALWQLDTQP